MTIDLAKPVTHNLATLQALPVGTTLGTESGVFMRKEPGEDCWTIACPDDNYPENGGYRLDRFRAHMHLPCQPLFVARATVTP